MLNLIRHRTPDGKVRRQLIESCPNCEGGFVTIWDEDTETEKLAPCPNHCEHRGMSLDSYDFDLEALQ